MSSSKPSDVSSPWATPHVDGSDADIAYGKPCSPAVAAEQFGEGRDEELPIYAAIVLDKEKAKTIKPRRGVPAASVENFFSSLVRADDGRVFFSGILNDFPGLNLLEVASIEEFRYNSKKQLTFNGEMATWASNLKVYWTAEDPGEGLPKCPEVEGVEKLRVTLYQPRYKKFGMEKNNLGNIWYYSQIGTKSDAEPRIAVGRNIIECIDESYGGNATAVKVTHFGHRYAKPVESFLDKGTYHTAVLIEWEYEKEPGVVGNYCTVVELAWLHGIGGYKGKSNWVADKEIEGGSKLYHCLPAEMKFPWQPDRSEIRIIDLPYGSFEEFEQHYLQKYTGNNERFLNPAGKATGNIVLEDRSKKKIFEYLHNRIMWDQRYSEPSAKALSLGQNCQTFAATFFSLLTGHAPRVYALNIKTNDRRNWFVKSPADVFTPPSPKKQGSFFGKRLLARMRGGSMSMVLPE